MCVVKFVFALSQLQGVEWGGLVGGNPTMNTLLLCRGGVIASSSNLFISPVLVFLYSIFCCESASEFGAMGSTFFFGVFLP